jgi:hypothetical protein
MSKRIYQIVKCPFCNEKRKSNGLHMHIKTHGDVAWEKYLKMKPEKEKKSILLNTGKYKCSECNYTGSKHSVCSHWWRAHTEDGKNHSEKSGIKKGEKRISPVWNKGLTKETDGRVKKNAEAISKTAQQKIKNGTYISHSMGIEARKKLSKEMSLRNRGGKCKWFCVAGQKVQGTWEREIALLFAKEGINWYKPKTHKDVWIYKINGKEKSYTPDFYLQDYNCYFEIKGYWWGEDKEKMEKILRQYPERKLYIIMKNDYNFILKNGIKKYLIKISVEAQNKSVRLR